MPRGSDEYEQKRAAILQRMADSIPVELRLPQHVVDPAPKNVTNIPRESGLLTERELDITENYDAVALAEAIATKAYTAVEVAAAFCKRAVIAHQLTCCLTEFFMDEALARARELDDHLAATGRTVGPLHGVPTSVKAHMPLRGHLMDLGTLSSERALDFDSQAVAIVRDAGAVFYCKTNQPQFIMHLESASFHGRTLNPHNTALTSGGSSGGEAALLAMRGSAFGIGSDIGGSIRAPSAFCGVYGFKPTSNLLPRRDGLLGGSAGEMTVPATWGPMSRSLRDMDLFMAVFSAAQPWRVDPRLSVVPWTGLATPPPPAAAPLKVGFMMTDGAIQPQPPVVRAMEWAKARLQGAAEIEVKPFAPLRTREAAANARTAYFPYGVDAMRRALEASGEPFQALSEWSVRDAEAAPTPTAQGLFELADKKERFWYDWAAHWAEQDVDVVVCPAFYGPAAAHTTAFYWNYTILFNYLDMPAVVLPTPVVAGGRGAERYADDDDDGTPLSEECEHARRLWDEGDFEGAPIAIQIVARRQHDNELFGALERLKKYLDVKQ
ncbi:hypothetical protein V2A60_004136 [Cordyceps javanica]